MKRSKYYLIGFILFVSVNFHATGQYFSAGQDPANIKWEQIPTKNYQIIFPEDFSKEALRLASILDRVYELDSYSLNHKPKKISIILHTHSTEANAFVTWAPKRSEFYTIPSQSIYPQEWLTQLAIHEIRHVVQIDKLTQGLTKILSIILGEQGTGAIAGMFLPLWFLEGDAVASETALSESGRGRLPSFEMPVRALTVEKGIYSYEKAIFGSYKDFVPNHYHIGYLLVAYGRKNYGTKMWEYSIDNVARKPYTLLPFSNGIKKYSHRNKWQYYKEAMNTYDSVWTHQIRNNYYKSYNSINPRDTKIFTSYRFPQYLNDSVLIAEKSGLGDIKTFVQISKSEENHLFTPGLYSLNRISANEKYITWHENLYHVRWENALGSKIMLFDLQRKRKAKIAPAKNLFSPSISHDSKLLVAVKSTSNNNFSIVVIDILTKKIIKEISLPENNQPINPTWSASDSTIISICLGAQGKAMISVNYNSGKIDTLVNYSYKDISQPVDFHPYVLFHGVYNGRDNIFAVNKLNKKIRQVTFSKYGGFDPAISPNRQKLAFSNYTPDGYNVVEIILDTNRFVEPVKSSTYFLDLAHTISQQELQDLSFTKDTIEREIKPYSKLKHLLNFHSWSPAYIDVNSYSISPGAVLLSQNELSTAFTTIGYRYSMNERAGRVEGGFTYLGFYPTLTFLASRGNRASTYLDLGGIRKDFKWNETRLDFQIRQPLNLTSGKYISGVTPGVLFRKIIVGHEETTPSTFYKGHQNSVQGQLFFYRQLKRSPRDLRPKWGQIIDANFGGLYLDDIFYRSFYNLGAILYVPGLVKHHSLRVGLGYEYLPQGRYNNYSALIYPRGYIRQVNSKLKKVSFDYKLPVAYPDFKFGPLIYLQRIKLNLFFDYAVGVYQTKTNKYTSMGVEVTNDLHLLNFSVPLDVGFRYIYMPSILESKLELLFSVKFEDL